MAEAEPGPHMPLEADTPENVSLAGEDNDNVPRRDHVPEEEEA